MSLFFILRQLLHWFPMQLCLKKDFPIPPLHCASLGYKVARPTPFDWDNVQQETFCVSSLASYFPISVPMARLHSLDQCFSPLLPIFFIIGLNNFFYWISQHKSLMPSNYQGFICLHWLKESFIKEMSLTFFSFLNLPETVHLVF